MLLVASAALAHEPELPSGTTAPVLIEKAEPEYPRAAIDAGVGGTVGLELTIGEDGNIAAIKIVKPAGFGLDEAAVAAARRFRFRPATHDGKPVASMVLFDQNFVIRPHLTGEKVATPEPPAPSPVPSYESVVVGRGPMSAASSSTIRNLDFDLRPKNSPNDILQVVPGLVTAQHQGGGKADQLFLRGFDADHGTDVGIFVDGVPVNLPSHAHGQGYADLHWLIPEIIERIDVEKGPYDVRNGDFSTAGAVNFETKKIVDESSVSFSFGGFPTLGCDGGASQCKLVAQERFVGIAAPRLNVKLHPWVAVEIARDQGPFTHAEGLTRYNVFGKLDWDVTPSTSVGLLVEAYGSGWNSSGQIPAREVNAGRLGRFDAVDPTEGGQSERQMVTLYVHHRDPANEFDATVYVTRYRLALWNDFTFFVNDPVNGDEIEQDDARVYAGANLAYHRHTRWRSISFRTTAGAQLRWDGTHVDLWNDAGRVRLSRRLDPSGFMLGNDDDIAQLNLAAYLEEDVVWTRWLRTIAGLRADYFGFDVSDQTAPANSGARQKTLLSPKASIVLTPLRAFDLYLNFGMGFHTNDARIEVTSSSSVPRFYGGEVGARYSFRRYFSAAAAFWASYLESETVFSGDDAAFIPSQATTRYGFDLELRAQPLSWLYVDFDLAQAKATTASGGELALAPKLYLTGGVTAKWRGLRAGLRFRYLGARPAFDTDSAEYRTAVNRDAADWFVMDLYGAYRWRWLEAGFTIQNLTNADWREAQVGNHSCTHDEVYNPANASYAVCGVTVAARTGVADVHFTPGVPFDLQLTLRAYF
jgi:TonB family protein